MWSAGVEYGFGIPLLELMGWGEGYVNPGHSIQDALTGTELSFEVSAGFSGQWSSSSMVFSMKPQLSVGVSLDHGQQLATKGNGWDYVLAQAIQYATMVEESWVSRSKPPGELEMALCGECSN